MIQVELRLGQTGQTGSPSSILLGQHSSAVGDLPGGHLAYPGCASGLGLAASAQPHPLWGNRILLWHQQVGSVTCAWSWLLLIAGLGYGL